MKLLLILWWFIKITGILLGILLGLVLLILLIILISPIQYKVNLKKEGSFFAQVQVIWLYKLIYYRYRWKQNGKQQIDLYLLGRKRYKKQPLDSGEIKKREEKIEQEIKEGESKKQERTELEQEKLEPEWRESAEEVESKTKEVESKSKREIKEERRGQGNSKEKNQNDLIKETLKKYPYKVDLIKETYNFMKKLIIYILPNDYQIYWEFGLEDPSETGYVLGIISMITPFLGDDVHIKGNFQEEIMEGRIQATGKIQIGVILKKIVVFIWSLPVRKLIKIYLKQRKEGE